MARKIQWLEFVSAKERARQAEKTRRRLMPQGDEQRAAEIKLLRTVINTKADDTDLIFQLLQAKECLVITDGITDAVEANAECDAALREWLQSPLARRFARVERAAFLALAQAEWTQGKFDASLLPSPEELQNKAGLLLLECADLI